MPLIPATFARSGSIASGNVGWPHLASGAVRSGHIGNGAVVSGSVGLGQIASGHLASGVLAGIIPGSGTVGSGAIQSGSVGGFFGARQIASGTVGVFDFGSGAVIAGSVGSGAIRSGNIGSGAVGNFHISSGAVTSGRIGTTGTPDGSRFLRDDFSWSIPTAAGVTSGAIGSGAIASGAVQGFFGTTPNIASGTVGVFDFGSGAVIAGAVGSGAVRSGNLASGQVGNFHISSGSVTSGRLGTTGTPDGTKFLRDDFTWITLISGLTSGVVGSGFVASGAVQGFFGTTPNIASGTVGVFDFGSGAVIAGAVGSGAVRSGNIASGQIGTGHLADGAVTSGDIASGNVGWPHLASGSVRSGHISTTGTPNGTLFLRDDFSWAAAGGGLTSGAVGSGYLASGSVRGFFGTTRDIASGTVGVFDFGSGAVVAGSVGSGAIQSGNIGSGVIGNFHIASGAVTSGRLGTTGTPNGTLFLRDDFSWAAAGGGLSSGAVGSGYIASGAVQGFFGSTPNIASGTVGVFDFGSGAVIAGAVGSGAIRSGNIASGVIGTFHLADSSVTSGDIASGQITSFHVASGQLTGFELGSGAIVSGRIASGQIGTGHLANGAVTSGDIASGNVGWPHLASGAVRSGHLSTTGTPDGTLFLRDDFSWAAAGGGLSSGVVGSGYIASGAVQGFFGSTRHIASGTVGVFDFGSGAVTAGSVGSGAVVSGNVASGQISTNHLASGTVVTFARGVTPLQSGIPIGFLTEELISGVRAVQITESGTIRIAKASLSGFMPAVGVVIDNVASGLTPSIYTEGVFVLPSGMLNASGFGGNTLYVGRSGQIVTTSGWFNSGGLLSGDTWQPVAVSVTSGSVRLSVAAQMAFVPGLIYSGDIASGQIGSTHVASGAIQGFFGTFRNIASGSVGVFDFGSGAVIAGTVGSGAVRSGNIGSGAVGNFHIASGSVTSGRLGATGTPNGTLFLRDDFSWAAAGGGLSSGAVGSGYIASGAVQGFFGSTPNIASGTVGVFDFGSGAVIAGAVGSGAVVSGNIASGQVGYRHMASGAIQSGFVLGSGSIHGFVNGGGGYVRNIASGSLGTDDFASGSIITISRVVAPFRSGQPALHQTEEMISGVRAVCMTESGTIKIAMASVSGRMPAVGVVLLDVVSGFKADVFTDGAFVLSSGMINLSGYAGQTLYVGRSGQLVTVSGWFNSGGLLSGDVWQAIGFGTLSGCVQLSVNAQMTSVSGFVTSGNVASGQIGPTHLASGAVQGFFGTFRQVASGTIGVFDFGSGAVIAGTVGSGAVVSGNIASGVVGQFHIASGSVTSGRLGVTGAPDGSKFLRDDFTWQAAGGGLTSGAVQSGHVASGAVQGFFGATRNIASGTVGVFDFGSGAVIAGSVGSGAVVSGNVASGQLANNHLASGATITLARGVTPFFSGGWMSFLTEERISGVRAVCVSESGTIRIAKAGLSGFMPAVGVVIDNVASGDVATVYTAGVFILPSGMLNASGFAGKSLYVGRSGQLVTVSGWFNSGGLLSGDIWQPIANSVLSGCVQVATAAVIPFTPSLVYSGDIGSGQVSNPHFASGSLIDSAQWSLDNTLVTTERISGAVGGIAVAVNQSGLLITAMASVSGRMPAIGIVTANVVSGATATVYRGGRIFDTALNFTNFTTQPVYVGRSGQLSASGAPNFSGDYQQIMGVVLRGSGMMLQVGDALTGVIAQSGNIGSGAVIGEAGLGYRNIASGTIGTNDVASGALMAQANKLAPFYSGTFWTLVTEEPISGGRFVQISQSGYLRIAMASVSGRMPAIGWINDNVASGIQANVYSFGPIRPSSGMVDFVNNLGRPVWVGRSGQAAPFSGSWTSAGLNLASGGDFIQRFGVAFNSGAFMVVPEVSMGQTQLLATTNTIDVVNRAFGV